jgi:hypothetical protein
MFILRKMFNALLGYPLRQGGGKSPSGASIPIPLVELGSSIDDVIAVMNVPGVQTDVSPFWAGEHGPDYQNRSYHFHPKGSPALISFSYSYSTRSGQVFRISTGNHRAFFSGQIGDLNLTASLDNAVDVLGPPTNSDDIAAVRAEHWWIHPSIAHHVSCYTEEYEGITGVYGKGEIDLLSAWLPAGAPEGFCEGLDDEDEDPEGMA